MGLFTLAREAVYLTFKAMDLNARRQDKQEVDELEETKGKFLGGGE